MEITITQTDGKSLIEIPGSFDVMTSPHMKKALNEAVSAADEVELDFSKTELVTSAGLRVLLQAQKSVQALGKSMTMKNISPDVMEVFDMTGVTNIFTIL